MSTDFFKNSRSPVRPWVKRVQHVEYPRKRYTVELVEPYVFICNRASVQHFDSKRAAVAGSVKNRVLKVIV